jgi:hypothetical protein
MISTVVKHSYIKGRNGKDRCRAHINYISHRRGEDREQGGRKFFDKEREGLTAAEVKNTMYERSDNHSVFMHKMILSPGLDVDAKEYTRELMEKLERIKGQPLDWRAVIHENTEHQHVHLILMGKDLDGTRVSINRNDHIKLREWGNEYLSREHKLERYLDREIEDLLRSRDFDRGHDEIFKRTLFGDGWQKNRDDDPERARREFEELDEKLRQSLEDKRSADLYPKPWEQRTIEQAGRLSEHHGDYTNVRAKERLEEISQRNPELADTIQKELDFMREIATENRSHIARDFELEHVLGWGRGSEIEAERAAQTHENDRQTKPEQLEHNDRSRDEQEDFDPLSG